jgi:hypothetical protein
MLGVSTTGNATLIAYDDKPILATDPWFGDENPAYFGSWGLSHRIPPDCKRDILNAKYIWFSHGDPDHLNGDSLQQLRGKHILLADHVGGRIAHDLRAQGCDVTILPDREWVDLSPRIRVFCITTMIQDSVLLIEVNKRLFANLNDAGSRDCTLLIRKIAAEYEHSYLLCLSGYGDADMINFYDENGLFVVPTASQKAPVGRHLSLRALSLGIHNVIPFSSFHAYQRTDSIWAQNYVTPLEDYSIKFDHTNHNFIPPFSHIDCATGEVTPLNPESMETVLRRPEEFGDNWSDVLEHGELDKLAGYFRSKERVRDYPVVHQFPRRRPRQLRLAGRQEGTRHHVRGSPQQPDDGDRLRNLRRSPDREFHEDDFAQDGLALRRRFRFRGHQIRRQRPREDTSRGRRLSAGVPPARGGRLVLSPAL